jgi:hypothetical protein
LAKHFSILCPLWNKSSRCIWDDINSPEDKSLITWLMMKTSKVWDIGVNFERSENDAFAWFSHVVRGNESWFSYRYQYIHYYIRSREEVRWRTNTTIATTKVLIILFVVVAINITSDYVFRTNPKRRTSSI